jgi:hypothetical protein
VCVRVCVRACESHKERDSCVFVYVCARACLTRNGTLLLVVFGLEGIDAAQDRDSCEGP